MFSRLVTIGRNAELRSVGGKQILNLSVVYDIGSGQNVKSQWLSLTMWGSHTEKLVQYLTKGKQIVVNVPDLHQAEHNGKSYLKGTIQSFDFVRGGGGGQDKHNEDKSNGYQPQPRQQQQNNNFDDDLPF